MLYQFREGQSDEQKDDQAMIRVVHDDQTSSWEQMFLTLEGDARKPFLFSPNTSKRLSTTTNSTATTNIITHDNGTLEAERRRQFEDRVSNASESKC
jgi:hypothetical protein